MVQGKSYTSNHVKLLKHLDKLQLMQEGKPTPPVIVHISINNTCNLTCSFCCFANRDLGEQLPTDRVKKALTSFRKIGVKSIEFTGGGEPTLHPDFSEIAKFAHDLGFKMGLCTNGKTLGTRIKKETVALFDWVRIGLYGFTENYDYDLSVFEGTKTEVSGAYIWDEAVSTSDNPNVTGQWVSSEKKKLATNFQTRENFLRMIDWVEKNKIPTRIAFNVIKDLNEVEKNIETIRGVLAKMDLKYCFLSDFNFKQRRRNHHCYMHLVKPFLYTDGIIYVCPCAEMSVENRFKVNDQFKVCDIDGIEEYYSKPPTMRLHGCRYCKYAYQNELVDDVMTPTTHNEFV